MARARRPARRAQQRDTGISRWDVAPDAPMPCVRCAARTMMSQIEPPTGAGRGHYLIRCRRCRHEVQNGPIFQSQAGPVDLEEAWRVARGNS